MPQTPGSHQLCGCGLLERRGAGAIAGDAEGRLGAAAVGRGQGAQGRRAPAAGAVGIAGVVGSPVLAHCAFLARAQTLGDQLEIVLTRGPARAQAATQEGAGRVAVLPGRALDPRGPAGRHLHGAAPHQHVGGLAVDGGREVLVRRLAARAVAGGVHLLRRPLLALLARDLEVRHHAHVLVRQDVAVDHVVPDEGADEHLDDDLGRGVKQRVVPVAVLEVGVRGDEGRDLEGQHVRVQGVLGDAAAVSLRSAHVELVDLARPHRRQRPRVHVRHAHALEAHEPVRPRDLPGVLPEVQAGPVAHWHLRVAQVHEVAGPSDAELRERRRSPRAAAGLRQHHELHQLLDHVIAVHFREGREELPHGVRQVLLLRVLRGGGGRRLQAAVAGPREEALAGDGHVRAVAPGQVDLVDVARGDVQVDAVLGQQLQVALHAVLACRQDREQQLDCGKDHPQAVPAPCPEGEFRLPLAVHERNDVVLLQVRALVLAVQRLPEVARARLLKRGRGRPGLVEAETQVQQADDHELGLHVLHLLGQRAGRVLDEEGAVHAAPGLHRGGVVEVRVVPVGAGHVVALDGELKVERLARVDLIPDGVRALPLAVGNDVLGRRHVEPVRVEVRGVQLAEAVPRENQLLAP
mmetsp:Transcript_65193/g.202050  ORF Transcript_65193/g.202050 Transcript_65193/m.202050 type:complete len:634 (+) Transcript_65193:444-2345(+)